MKRKIAILLTSSLFFVGISFGQYKPDFKVSPNKPISNNGIEFRTADGHAVFSYTTGLNFSIDNSLPIGIEAAEPIVVAMAIDLPKDTYKGQEIAGATVHIRRDLYENTLPDNLKLIVVEKDSEMLIGEKAVETTDIKEGFNTIILDEPIPIKEGKTYQIGYSIVQETDQSSYWSTYDTEGPSIPEATRYTTGQASRPIENWSFKDISDQEIGALAVFVLIKDVDGKWENAASTSAYKVDKNATAGEIFSGTMYINNRGTTDITSATFSYQVGDEAEKIVKKTTKIEPGYCLPITVEMTSSKAGNIATKIRLTAINDDESNPIKAETFTEVTRVRTEEGSSEMKSVLYERFTTEHSLYCPEVDPVEKQSREELEKLGIEVSRIAHHAWRWEDWLTNKDSEPLVDHLRVVATPNVAINRYVHNEAFTLHPLNPYFPEMSAECALESIKYGTAAKITDVEQVYDRKTQGLTVKVKGEAYADADPNNVYVNIVITEGGIEAINQIGVIEEGPYIHYDVPRIFATGTYGEQATITDGTFSVEVNDIKISEEYKTDNMKVVVFLSRNLESPEYEWDINLYDSTTKPLTADASTEGVGNQAEVFVTSRDGAIVIEGEYNSVLVYDLAGRQVAQTDLAAGVYVVRVETPQGVAVRKVAVR